VIDRNSIMKNESLLKNQNSFDVVILGGGPAGCATAMALRLLDDYRILVLESGDYSATRFGECIPPNTRLLFRDLEILEEFDREKHEPNLGSCSSWGADELGYNDFVYNPYGNGWHLDRRRFDHFLSKVTRDRGVKLVTGTRYETHKADDDGFQIQFSSNRKGSGTVRARRVVDATGCGSGFAQHAGAEKRVLDQLICVCGFFHGVPKDSFPALTVLEAVEYGWWYAAKLPNNRLAVAVASEPRIVKEMVLRDERHFMTHLANTKHLSLLMDRTELVESRVVPAPAISYLLDHPSGRRWIAVGDAASAFDPISSQGIFKSLSDGIEAARAIHGQVNGDSNSLEVFDAYIVDNFEEYLKNRNHYYGVEQRWWNSPFWKGRRARKSLPMEHAATSTTT